jgi:hypothetical protein
MQRKMLHLVTAAGLVQHVIHPVSYFAEARFVPESFSHGKAVNWTGCSYLHVTLRQRNSARWIKGRVHSRPSH